MRWRLVVVGMVGAVVVACSGSDSSVVSADTACASLSDAICKRLDECLPLLVQLQYGDVIACKTRTKINCVPTLNAPGSALTTSQVASCANAFATPSCDDVVGRVLPAECRAVAGSLADGAACGDDSQCANKKCKKQKSATCGACTSPAAAGSPCEADDNCDYALVCAKNGVCVAQGAGGTACDDNHPCKTSFLCKGGTCTANPAEGAACDPVAQDCSLVVGDFCDPKTKVCAKIGTASGGGACGLTSGGLVVCTSSGVCKTAGAQGTCVAPAVDGASCDATNGPGCTPPARCDGGACKLPDPSACK